MTLKEKIEAEQRAEKRHHLICGVGLMASMLLMCAPVFWGAAIQLGWVQP
ncbi:MAG: hypothetical protein KG075_09475 [Alphaproteobacteria bacterium]|nr:hypothetical protein [Alphaproteobacteria bacterium]